MIVSGLRELNRCGALAKALSGRDYSTLGPLLRFLCRHIGRQKFLRTLLVTADTLVGEWFNVATDFLRSEIVISTVRMYVRWDSNYILTYWVRFVGKQL